MQLASEAERLHAAGAEIVAISVDDVERQAGMFARWPTPTFSYIADPGGCRFLKPLGVFDPEDRGGIALPLVLVLDPAGEEIFRHEASDTADRCHGSDVVARLEALHLAPIGRPGGGPSGGQGELSGSFPPSRFSTYFKGGAFAAGAIEHRARGDEARMLARQYREMCAAFLDAWQHLR